MEQRAANAIGLATISYDGTVLDSWYPSPQLTDEPCETGTRRLPQDEGIHFLGERAARFIGKDDRRGVEVTPIQTKISCLSDRPIDTHDTYLRLHLLSHRVIRPHGANLDGMFQHLTTVAWTSIGPCPLDRIEGIRLDARATGAGLTVHAVDKIPRMTDYVIPSGIRIADANRVRLGAHLAPDTMVMHEGFCNFNAGTLGKVLLEGGLNAGIVVGDGSHVGYGVSTMGTMSGGGKHVVSVGKRCLLGANSGIGISLGDDCIVEAGLYLTVGTLIRKEDGSVVKANQLSGHDGIVFRRNAQTGAVEALRQTKSWGTPVTNVL